MTDAPICFVHIPKCAGGTLKTVFIRAFGAKQVREAGNYFGDEQSARRACEKVARKIGRAPVALGHVPYAIFQANGHNQARYITLLRDPVERVLSHYHRHIHGKARNGGFDNLADALAGVPELANLCTRMLCDNPDGDLTGADLDAAMRNIEAFAFVGIQERFDESLVLLHHALGIELTPYGESIHVNHDGRPRAETIPDADRALILKHNALDAALYGRAKAIFDRHAAAVPNLHAEVERFRAMCADAAQEDAARRRQALEWLAGQPQETRRLPVGDLKSLAGGEIRPRHLQAARKALGREAKQARRLLKQGSSSLPIKTI